MCTRRASVDGVYRVSGVTLQMEIVQCGVEWERR